jgi:hypothetical protein
MLKTNKSEDGGNEDVLQPYAEFEQFSAAAGPDSFNAVYHYHIYKGEER